MNIVEVAVARSEPASAAVVHCTVVLVLTVDPQVVVTIICGELHTVAVTQRIDANVTRVPGHLQPVVVCLTEYNERAVLGVVPGTIGTFLQVKSQLVAAGQCQLTE